MDFSQVKAVAVPEGNVKQISVNGTVIWSAIRNVFDKTKLSEYGYKGSVYDLDGVEAVKIYDATNNGLNIEQGFAEGKQYKIIYTTKFVSTHGLVRLIVTYLDGTSQTTNYTPTESWVRRTRYTDDNKSVKSIAFTNAGNGIGYAYYLNINDLEIVEV